MRMSVARLVGYSMGAFGTGVFSTVPTILLLFFCTETLRIPPALAGVAVFAPKVWALVWDPFVGHWSDSTRSRLGRRRPFLFAGSFGVSLAFLALFNWRYPLGPGAFLPVAVIYFLLASAYSVFAVPFVALPAEISDDPAVREGVSAWRIGFAMVGVLIGAALAPWLVEKGGGGRAGYAFMACIVATICGAGMLSAFIATPTTLSMSINTSRNRLGEALSVLVGDPALMKVVAAYILQLAGIGLMSALTPYWITDILHQSGGFIGVMLGTMLLVSVVSTPLWAWLGRQIGAGNATMIAAGLYGVVTLLFLAIRTTAIGTPFAYGLYGLLGLPFAGLQVGPFSLAANLIHRLGARSGLSQQGLFTGFWTAAEKLGLALGPGIAGLGLAVSGFNSGNHAQSGAALAGVRLLIAVLPALLTWSSLPFLIGLGVSRALAD